VPSILDGMLTENLMRKDFTVSERVAIYQAIKTEIGSRKGQRTDLGLRDKCPEVEPGERTDDFAAKRAGLGNRKTADRAEQVVSGGVSKLVEAMDSGEISVSAAAEIAGLPKKQQKEVLDGGCDHGKLVARQVRAYKQQNRYQEQVNGHQEIAGSVAPRLKWTVTGSQRVVRCDLLIVDPPYGILDEVDWEPADIEQFTREWASKWAKCEADFVVVFFSQRHMWDGRRWLDESLAGYEFQQMLVWHAPNNKAPKSRKWLKQTWEPIFLYRRTGSDRMIHDHGSWWTGELHDFDCHVAPVPQTTYSGHKLKQHPCQKPVSAMKWLINAMSKPGEKVVSLFSGVSPCGIAALQLGREYHGIEKDQKLREIAQTRMEAFGTPERRVSPLRKLKLNSVVEGDCLELIPLLANQSIHCVVTSPPYGEQKKEYYPGVPERLYPEFTARWMELLRSKLTEDASVLIVIDTTVDRGVVSDYVLQTQLLLRDHGWKQHRTLFWHKPDTYPLGHKGWPRHCYEEILWFSKTDKPFCDPMANGTPRERLTVSGYAYSQWSAGTEKENAVARMGDVLTVPINESEKGIPHPAKFPAAVPEALIKTFCPPKGCVLDPFCGSGTTLLAARQLGRTFYGFDLLAEYVALARDRLANKRNGKAARNVV